MNKLLALAALLSLSLYGQIVNPGGAGGGGGSVTSITIAGTTNQIAVTGTCTGTATISCTLSLPSGVVLPGTINGLTITTTTGTLTVTGAKVLTVSNSLTLAGTDSTTITFPATSATIARTDAGQTFTGTQVFSSSPTVPTVAQNDNSTKAASTAYTDLAVANAIAGVNPAVAVLAASTANLTGTYANGVSGIGATFTVTATGTFTLDGIAINTIGQRVLLKNQSSGFQNGVYTATIVGAVAVSPVFTRALDYDMPSDINSTGAIPVQSGTVNALTSWLLTSAVTTVGTDALTYSQFSVSPTTCSNSTGMCLISDQTVGSAVATVTFSSIPGTYKHLQLEMEGRCSASALVDTFYVQANGDTMSNYSQQFLKSNHLTVTATDEQLSAKVDLTGMPCATALANTAGTATMKFTDYAGTTFTKSGIDIGGTVMAASIAASALTNYFVWWNWNSNAAITSLTVGVTGGSNFVTGSRFTLYGLN